MQKTESEKDKSNILNMTSGNPMRLIIMFALPIFAGNLFQQLYNVCDIMIAGYNLGDDAVAAIGATGSIYSLIIGLSNGLNNGYAIIVARFFGAKNREKLKKSVALMLVFNIAASLFLTVISAAAIEHLLYLLKTPAEIFDQAYQYIFIILLGMPATIAYNMEAGLLRALGNSKTPLFFLILSSIANIVLDLFFIAVLHTGVRGAAFATVVSQILSVVLCFIHILRHFPELRLEKRDFCFSTGLAADMFITGLSMGMMSSIFSIGSVVLQSAINGLGTAVVTAHTVARKIVTICMQPLSTLSTANATFVSQNFGAGKMNRIITGIKKTCLAGFVWSAFIFIVVNAFAGRIVTLFSGTTDGEVIKYAVMNLRINMPFYFPLGILFVLRTSLQGLGRKAAPLISSGIEMAFKLFATWVLVPLFGYVGASIAEPLTWLMCMLFLSVSFFKVLKTKKEIFT